MSNITVVIDNHMCQCNDTNIHIVDSYQIPNNKIKPFLNRMLKKINGRIIYKRTIDSWEKEWIAHNRMYKLGLYRSHTKDVDLDEDESKGRLFVYKVLGEKL